MNTAERKMIACGLLDDAVVSRFNELCGQKKIESPMAGAGWCIIEDCFRLRVEEQPINRTATGFQKNENDLWEEVRALRERLLDTQSRLEHLRSYVYQKMGGVE